MIERRQRYFLLTLSTKKDSRPADAPVRRQPQQGDLSGASGRGALLALRTAKRPPVNGEGGPFSACRRDQLMDVFSGLADAKEAQVSLSGVALGTARCHTCGRDRQRPVTSYFVPFA